MSSATADAVVREPLMARVAAHLKNWGKPIKNAVKKTGGFIKRAAKWVVGTTVAQWVISKASWVGSKLWHVAKGPVGWVAAPILALLFAPKAVVFMLAMVLVGVVGLGVVVFLLYRQLKRFLDTGDVSVTDDGKVKVTRVETETKEDGESVTFSQVTDTVTVKAEPKAEPSDDAIIVWDFNGPIADDETLDTRYDFLDRALSDARERGDHTVFSEAYARMRLHDIRNQLVEDGRPPKLKADASPGDIYRDARAQAEKADRTFAWDWNRMNQGVKSESKRFREITEKTQAPAA